MRIPTEALVNYVWPLRKLAARPRLAARCARCNISERVPGVTLQDGECQYCRDPDPEPKVVNLAPELREFLHAYARSGRQYDALVMLSGGKDSAYVLWRVQRDHPTLRLLAVTIDNGFLANMAIDNAAITVRKLDVSHMILTPPRNLYRDLYRYAFTHVGTGGCYVAVDRLDGHLTHDICRNIAAAMQIPLVLSGVSWAQVEMIVGCNHFLETGAEDRVTLAMDMPFREAISPEHTGYLYDARQWSCRPLTLFPHYAWRADDVHIRREVERLGLVTSGSPLDTNNTITPLMVAVDFATLGYCGFAVEFARMVRAGQSDRRLWRNVFELMEYEATSGHLSRRVIEPLRQLGLTRRDVGLEATKKLLEEC